MKTFSITEFVLTPRQIWTFRKIVDLCPTIAQPSVTKSTTLFNQMQGYLSYNIIAAKVFELYELFHYKKVLVKFTCK